MGNCGNGKIKRELKKTANEGVNEIVCEGFFSVRAKNHSVAGPLVQEYAKNSLKDWGRLNSNHLTDGRRVFAMDIR